MARGAGHLGGEHRGRITQARSNARAVHAAAIDAERDERNDRIARRAAAGDGNTPDEYVA